MGERIKNELNRLTFEISDDKKRALISGFLEHVPDTVFEKPACSSGKYHNPKDNAVGGLMWHLRTTLRVAQTLIDAMGGGPSYDHVRAAAIIHDLLKYGEDGTSPNTVFEHPLLGAAAFRDFCAKKRLDERLKGFVSDVVRLVERHHGRFTTSKYSEKKLPKAERVDEMILHFADMVSSAEYMDAISDKFGCIPGEHPF